MNNLIVKDIKRSIELMDEFEDGYYDYLELEHWFFVGKTRGVAFYGRSSTDHFHINLLISKKRDRKREISMDSPTMTELRKMQYHGIYLDGDYSVNSMDGIIRDACLKWEKDVVINLPMQICLRAQTSNNRTDYGCEWLGGGDWIEKTLYGDTTDFFITAIVLKALPKTLTERSEEFLNVMLFEKESIDKKVMEILSPYLKNDMRFAHSVFGEGIIESITEERFKVRFKKVRTSISFKIPSGLLQGYLKIKGISESQIAALNRLNSLKQEYEACIEKLIDAIQKDDIAGMMNATRECQVIMNRRKIRYTLNTVT